MGTLYIAVLQTILTVAMDCSSVDSVRASAFLDPSPSDGCLQSKDPEVLRLLSDRYWWEQQWKVSEEFARQALNQNSLSSEADKALTRRLSKGSMTLRGGWGLSHQDSSQYNYGIEGVIKIKGANSIQYSFDQLQRKYKNGSNFYDQEWGLGFVFIPHPKSYLELHSAWVRDADFLPEQSYRFTPHLLIGSHVDLGLNLRWAVYSKQQSFSSGIQVLSEIFDRWSWMGRVDVLVTPLVAVTGSTGLNYKVHPFLFGVNYGGGKSDEGDGVIDIFQQVSGRWVWDLSSRLTLNLEPSWYRGDRRQETKLMGAMTWHF